MKASRAVRNSGPLLFTTRRVTAAKYIKDLRATACLGPAWLISKAACDYSLTFVPLLHLLYSHDPMEVEGVFELRVGRPIAI